MTKKTTRLTENEQSTMVNEIILPSVGEDDINAFALCSEGLHCDWLMLDETAIKPSLFADRYSEVLDMVVDYLVCICLYPNNPSLPRWKERVYWLCKRFAGLNITPAHKNTNDYRIECLNKAVVEVLDEDFGALFNHFKSVIAYYANRPNSQNPTPYKPYTECYEEQKNRVKNGIIALTRYVAEQDYDGIIKYIKSF